MGRHPTIDYELAATLVASGLTLDQTAAKVGAKNGQTVRQGLIRRGTNAYRLRASGFSTPSHESATERLASDASKLLRQSLGNTLAKHAAALDKVPVKSNLKHIKDFGDAIEPLARTGKIVHDWGNDDKVTLIPIGLVESWDSTQDAIDISTSVADATTGSVQEQLTEQQSIPSSELPDSQ